MKNLLILLFAVLAAFLQVQAGHDWENPRIFEKNQVPAHTPLMPYSNRQQALELDFAASDYHLSLDGAWRFLWSETPAKAPEGFYAIDYATEHWPVIQVPGNWQMQGFGHPLFRNIAHPFPSDPPFVPHDYNPVGSYRRSFQLPSFWQDRQIFLHFEGVKSASTVWINGDSVGYNQGGMEPAEYDITPYVRPGTNYIAVQVIRWSDGTYLEDQDMWRLSGIYRHVYLMATAKTHIRDFAIVTEFDTLYENARFQCNAMVKNYSSIAQSCTIQLALYDKRKRAVLSKSLLSEPLMLAGGEEKEVRLSKWIKNPHKWSAEAPNLYIMTLELVDAAGKSLEITSQRFGFRQVEIRDRALYINGKTVKLNGVNSHMHHPITGRCMDPQTMREDLILMKRFNINCVRTSHYPPDVEYLNLADELGVYVIDETGNEAHATPWLSDQARWRQAYVDRARKIILRDRNHPSVIIWSAGNESGSGKNICALVREGKRIDSSRPWLYGGNDDSIPVKKPLDCEDIIGPRYPTPFELEMHIARQSPQLDMRPSFPDEYAAATGNSLGALDAFWHVIRNYPRIIGGAIWDWVSPAIQSDWITVADRSPCDIDCTLMGKARLVTGLQGKALALSGHDDWLEIYRHPALDIDSTALTIAFWLFPRTWNGNGTFISKGSNQYGIEQISADSLEFYVYTTGRTAVRTRLPSDWKFNWHHIIAVYNGRELMLYVDDDLKASTPCSGPVVDTPFPVNIGRNAEKHGQEHAGYLNNALFDQVRIFASALNVEELQRESDSLVNRSVLWVDFDKAENRGAFYTTGLGGRTYGLVWPDRRVQPELWQVKKSAQPIAVEPVDLKSGKIRIFNRYNFTPLDRFVTRWQITANGRLVHKGETFFNIDPGEKVVKLDYSLPQAKAGTEYHLLIEFCLRDSTIWAPAGHVVAFEQMLLPVPTTPEKTNKIDPHAELNITQKGSLVKVGTNEWTLMFDRTSGMLCALHYRGSALLRSGPQLNVWRAPLANELDPWALNKATLSNRRYGMGNWVANGWWAADLHSLRRELKHFAVEKQPDGSIRIAANVIRHSNQYKTAFENHYDYIILQSGDIVIHHHMIPHGEMPAWLPRIGLKMQLGETLRNLQWYGRGPWETYPDRKTGAAVGVFSRTIQNDEVPYLLPQDYGNKTDVRWATLRDERGTGILISGGQPFQCSAHPYDLDNLTRSLYIPQLRKTDAIFLYVDHAVTGVGGTANSVLQKYRVLPQESRYRIRLRPLGRDDSADALYRNFDWNTIRLQD